MNHPSIFNNVIGPVMRGPSSSHSAAAARIGAVARAIMSGEIDHCLIEFDESGSLPATHTSQGSDMGLVAGLLGFDISDEKLLHYEKELSKSGISITYRYGLYGDSHPNTYRLTLENSEESHSLIALSTGGGMIEVTEIDGSPLSFSGDKYETLIYCSAENHTAIESILLKNELNVELHKGVKCFFRITRDKKFDVKLQSLFLSVNDSVFIKTIEPFLPITTPHKLNLPFTSYSQLLRFNEDKGLSLGELGLQYEAARGGVSERVILEKMAELVSIWRRTIKRALKGSYHPSRILGAQSVQFKNLLSENKLIDTGVLNTIILYTTALMEAKSSLDIIIAAPTAGSCGGLPGAIIGIADALNIDDHHVVYAMLSAGLVGVFIAKDATFAGEVAGCQAECGSSSGMAAAAIVNLVGGTASQALDAASMALQNSFGMVCDPVANRVEVPCLGKNIMAASNALSCANMALAGFDAVIPFDETVVAMDKVGRSIPHELRCTAKGGLSVTKSSKKIENALIEGATEGRWQLSQ